MIIQTVREEAMTLLPQNSKRVLSVISIETEIFIRVKFISTVSDDPKQMALLFKGAEINPFYSNTLE